MLAFISRVLVGLLFVVAGALKIAHPADLASATASMELGLPGPVIAAIALSLPAFEILLGVYLIGGWLLRATSLVATGLLAAFIVALSSVVLRGITAPCGCFGPGGNEPTTWWTVARDGAAIVPAIYLVWFAWIRATGTADPTSIETSTTAT